MSTFQKILLNLQNFWTSKNCILQQNHDLQTGAGTFNPETFLRALGPEPYRVCHVEISKRPTDGRYGENPNRLQRFHQFQVMIKPTPKDMQELYLESLEAIGLILKNHDIRFVHDDWESPTQGASGVGWEVWCDGMEITQFTYFQQIGGVSLEQIPAELAYGIERIALFLQGKANVYDLFYNDSLTYGEVFLNAEKQYCKYNFEEASVEMWQKRFDESEKESKLLIKKELPIPAYDMAVDASHCFNMLDARGAISTTARVSMIHRVRDLCCGAAESYLELREKLGFELLEENTAIEKRELSPVKEISSSTADFLLEIGTEHLPANAIAGASASLEKLFIDFLKAQSISYAQLEVFATPKRLAVLIHAMSCYTEEKFEERKGPSLNIAFDKEGNATKQGAGFFRSIGLGISTKDQMQMDSRIEIKDERLLFCFKKEKVFSGKLLQEHLRLLILGIAFPKKMRWGKEGVLFSRPIRSLVSLFNKQVIDLEIEGISSSNQIALNVQQEAKTVQILKPLDYLSKLRKGKVLACVKERRDFIDKQLDAISQEYETEILLREAVTSEVLFLSEYPILDVCSFDEAFLVLPEELIISEMVDHQKYWPMREDSQQISTKFIVAIDKKPSELILSNNERVLAARLSDGLFLYKKDLKASFDGWNHRLRDVTLHPKLGSIYNKVERIVTLSGKISSILNIAIEKNAALYCKADLVSDVVYEFPELQGIMGRYYALTFGENAEVASAIEESYMPVSEGSEIPVTKTGMVVALADRIDNLMSYMGIGLIPTSSKDPYALRRSAIGINRILIERHISFDLQEIIDDKKVLEFVIHRMKGLLKEYGFTTIDIEMCGVFNSFDPFNIYKCVEAIANIRASSETFSRLLEVYKRVKGSIGDDKEYTFSEKILKEVEEKALYKTLKGLEIEYVDHVKQKKYEEAFNSLTELVNPLEDFFENVRVQIDDESLRKNRMALLQIPYKLISTTLRF